MRLIVRMIIVFRIVVMNKPGSETGSRLRNKDVFVERSLNVEMKKTNIDVKIASPIADLITPMFGVFEFEILTLNSLTYSLWIC
jgi:hypothetical protein